MSALATILRAACAGQTVNVASFKGNLVCEIPAKYGDGKFASYERNCPAPDGLPVLTYEVMTHKTIRPPYIAIDAQDLAVLLDAWGPCGDCDGACPADLDGDCMVGAADLARVLDAW